MKILLTLVILACGYSAAVGQNIQLPIPSDPSAKYFVLKKSGTPARPVLTTVRVGSSGTSYAVRMFDCSRKQTKYLANGQSIEELSRSKPDPHFSSIVDRSIAYYQWQFACNR